MKILNVFTGGIFLDGICTSQMNFISKYDLNIFEMYILVYPDASEKMLDMFASIGCKFIYVPRRNRLFKYYHALKKVLKKEKFDIIHVHGSSSFMSIELHAAKKAKIKMRIAHSHNTKNNHPFLDKILRVFFYKQFTNAFACGIDAGHFLFEKHHFEVLHNGIDFEKFSYDSKKRQSFKKELNITSKYVFGHVGNLNKQKNHLFLIRIFAEILKKEPDSLLYIIGHGYFKQACLDLAKELNISEKIVFTGMITNVADILQIMDCMIMPSLHEGVPVVVTEWQCSGLPCLLSSNITEECSTENLVEFKSLDDSYESWAQSAIDLAKKNTNREENSNLNKQLLTIKGFNNIVNAKKLEKFYLTGCIEENYIG